MTARDIESTSLEMPRSALPLDEQTREFRQWLAEAQSGDNDACRRLLEVYGPHVVRAVRRNLDRSIRSKFDSADFAQAVWASFFTRPTQADQFDSPESLVGYLAAMAKNKVVDEHRRRLGALKYDVSREEPLRPDENQGLRSPQPTPSQVAVAGELWERLITGQPPHHQAILRLRREGLTNDEIAERLGLSEKTVRRLMKRLFEEQL